LPECAVFKYDEQEAIEKLARFKKSTDFLANNKTKLRKQQKDKYVAIKDGKFVDADEDIEVLRKNLKKKGMDAKDVLIEFMPSDEVIWIL